MEGRLPHQASSVYIVRWNVFRQVYNNVGFFLSSLLFFTVVYLFLRLAVKKKILMSFFHVDNGLTVSFILVWKVSHAFINPPLLYLRKKCLYLLSVYLPVLRLRRNTSILSFSGPKHWPLSFQWSIHRCNDLCCVSQMLLSNFGLLADGLALLSVSSTLRIRLVMYITYLDCGFLHVIHSFKWAEVSWRLFSLLNTNF